MARTVTINWQTTSTIVAGQFTPDGYKVTLTNGGSVSQIVPASPAVFTDFGSLQDGSCVGSIQLVDEQGIGHGPAVEFSFVLPVDGTMCNVPTNPNAVVVVV